MHIYVCKCVGMDRLGTSWSLCGVMVSTLAWNRALSAAIVSIFITAVTLIDITKIHHTVWLLRLPVHVYICKCIACM